MMGKPRYWHAAFPLAVTSLCMAPQALFLKHWQAFAESAISKLKVCLRDELSSVPYLTVY